MPVIIKAFQQLADSDVFHEVVGIHATDPAFSFFRPLGNNAATSQVRSEDSTVNAFPLSQLVTPRFQELDADADMDMDTTQGVRETVGTVGQDSAAMDVDGAEQGVNHGQKEVTGQEKESEEPKTSGTIQDTAEMDVDGDQQGPKDGEMDVNGHEKESDDAGRRAKDVENAEKVPDGEEELAVNQQPLKQKQAEKSDKDDEDGEGEDEAEEEPEVQVEEELAVNQHPLKQKQAEKSDEDDEDGEGEDEDEEEGEVQVDERGEDEDEDDEENEEENEDNKGTGAGIGRAPRLSRKRPAKSYAEGKRGTKRRKKHSSAAVVNEEEQVQDQEEESEEEMEVSRWVKLEEDIFVEAAFCNLDISKTGKEKLRLGRKVKAWGPKEESLEFEPVCHNEETLRILQLLVARVEECYAYEKPLHAKYDGQGTRKESVFKILSEEEFIALEDSAFQEILRRQNIVVTGMRCRQRSFEEALLDLAPLDSVTSIHDQSYNPDYHGCVRTGRVADILDASRSPDSKILNALEFPDPFAGIERSTFSSDSHALASVYRQEGWVKTAIPTEHVRWGLAATTGAFHCWHIDSDGFGTFIDPVAGSKWWIVARPRGNLEHDWFQETKWLKNDAFDLDKDGKGLFDVEAILLQPGSRLIMRPNTLHAVYTPEHAVCRGGHFYATSTMQDTFVGLVHAFICDKFITNTSHAPSRFILAEMINFYHTALVKNNLRANDPARHHVPALKTEESLMDFLVVCGLGVLINVLSLETYTAPGLNGRFAMDKTQAQQWKKYDINALSEDDRKLYCLARAQSFELIAWLNWNFSTGLENIPMESLFTIMLTNMCKMLCDYKWWADKEEIKCMADFTLERLQGQITGVLALAANRNPEQCGADDIATRGGWAQIQENQSGKVIRTIASGRIVQEGADSTHKVFGNMLDIKREITGAS
ncbi:hypothetical protein BJ912DRAFT_1064510 [Pholiota molesta]|nr:hypothetical protein BJ912DRAFT_1064510 [Pholiota molesta]